MADSNKRWRINSWVSGHLYYKQGRQFQLQKVTMLLKKSPIITSIIEKAFSHNASSFFLYSNMETSIISWECFSSFSLSDSNESFIIDQYSCGITFELIVGFVLSC